jgi:hypothetical protein
MFYAATNSYATETSIGFVNTWSVVGFEAKAMRDKFVKDATDLATRVCKVSEFGKYNAKRGQLDFIDAEGFKHLHCGNGEFAVVEKIM